MIIDFFYYAASRLIDFLQVLASVNMMNLVDATYTWPAFATTLGGLAAPWSFLIDWTLVALLLAFTLPLAFSLFIIGWAVAALRYVWGWIVG